MRILALLLLVGIAQAQGLNTSPSGVSRSVINRVTQSNSISTSTSAVSPWTLSNATVSTTTSPLPPGGGTWAVLTSTTTAGQIYAALSSYQNPILSSKVVGSLWVIGSGVVAFEAADCWVAPATIVTSCTCGRSDGGSCTATAVVGNRYCRVITTAGASPVRVWGAAVCDGIPGGPGWISLFPGEPGVSTGTASFSGVQREFGVTKPGRLCVTTTTSKKCG
jgi:hypothetical protein